MTTDDRKIAAPPSQRRLCRQGIEVVKKHCIA